VPVTVTCATTINRLRDRLGPFGHSWQTREMALSVENNNGVCLELNLPQKDLKKSCLSKFSLT